MLHKEMRERLSLWEAFLIYDFAHNSFWISLNFYNSVCTLNWTKKCSSIYKLMLCDDSYMC
jgi:hypothetical protein